MKIKKILPFILAFATAICMFALCSVSAGARATAGVTISSDPSYGGKVAFTSNNANDWGSSIYRKIWIDEETVTVSAKADPGYKFVKWGSPLNSTKNTVTITGLKDKETYYIKAYFEKLPDPEYNITVSNGTARDKRSWTTVTKSVAGREVSIEAAPAPEAGMVFDKWTVVSGGVTLANASESTTYFTMPAGPVSVKAEYRKAENSDAKEKVTLYFCKTIGTEEQVEIEAVVGETVKLPGEIFDLHPNGYGKVTGWKEWETGKVYAPGTKVLVTESTYYYVVYEKLPINIHFEIYDQSTATGTMAVVQAERDGTFTLPECTFTPKKGYIFDVWYYDDEYKPGDTIKLSNRDDTYVWARFKEDPNYSKYCVITYDNGYKGDKHDSYTEKVKKNSTFKLPKSLFSKPEKGVKFNGWSWGEVGKLVEVGDENEITITAKWAKSLSNYKVYVPDNEYFTDVQTEHHYVYSGEPIIPLKVNVTTGSGVYQKFLKEGVDFTVEYSNNINAGKADITVTGIGDYYGTAKGKFKIYPLSFEYSGNTLYDSFWNYKVILSKTRYEYDGKNHKPKIRVQFRWGDDSYDIPLSNFEVIYPSKSKKVGTYTVKLKPASNNIISHLSLGAKYTIYSNDIPEIRRYKEIDSKSFKLFFKNVISGYDKIEIQTSFNGNYPEGYLPDWPTSVKMTKTTILNPGKSTVKITFPLKSYKKLKWFGQPFDNHYLFIRARYYINGAPGEWKCITVPINQSDKLTTIDDFSYMTNSASDKDKVDLSGRT